jgi:integrase
MSRNNTFKFTKGKLKELKPSGEYSKSGKSKRRARYYDTASKGLELCVTETKKVFYTYKWLSSINRPQRVLIGPFPQFTITKARTANDHNIRQMSAGIDPSASKVAQREELTLGEVFQQLLEDYYSLERPNSVYDYQLAFKNHLNRWKNKKMSSIEPRDVIALRSRLRKEAGPSAANKVLRLLSSIFNKAIKNQLITCNNPASGISVFPTKPRMRIIAEDEMRPFLEAVYREDNDAVRDAVLLMLFTGVRKTNVLSAKWKNINLNAGTWFIPDTKSGTSQLVELDSEVIRILSERQGFSQNEWVFPAHKETKTGHVQGIQKGWRRILERADIQDLRLHDLRRTFASYQISSGVNLRVVQKTLNHKSYQATERAYAHFVNRKPIKRAVNQAVNEILNAGGQTRYQADIIPIEEKMRAHG